MILAYLGLVVAANLIITYLGPAWTPLVALVFIGGDITLRDKLHERWRGDRIFARMAALVAAGGVLTFILNPGAGRVAIASTAAFSAAGASDALVYHGLWNLGVERFARVNVSNVVSATLDSATFLLLAFGAVAGWIFLAQVAAKVFGGFLWSLVLFRE